MIFFACKGDLFGEDLSLNLPLLRSHCYVIALTYFYVFYLTRELFQEVVHLYQDFSFKFSEKLEQTYDLGASEVINQFLLNFPFNFLHSFWMVIVANNWILVLEEYIETVCTEFCLKLPKIKEKNLTRTNS